MTIKQNDGWSRKVVRWGHPELRSVSRSSSKKENQTSIKTSTVPGERELINAELNALLRWEDDGGQSSYCKSILFLSNGISMYQIKRGCKYG